MLHRVRALLALVAMGAALAAAPTALANPSFTWTGHSAISPTWSTGTDWEGSTAPTSSTAIGALTFPHLTAETCASSSPAQVCYLSVNDLSGLSAESMQIDDGDLYEIAGEELALGSGGLTATPAGGSSGPAGDFVEMPIDLTASQRWSVIDRSGGAIGENGMFLEGAVTGAGKALTIELGNGPLVYVENSTEVGPLTIEGANASEPGIFNGIIALEGGELNSLDGQAVNLSHIFLVGSGAVGQLTTNTADLEVGSGVKPAEGISAASVTLDHASHVGFEIAGPGTAPANDYSQIVSAGAIELGGASFEAVVRPPSETATCPVLKTGETYTFLSTSGALSGTFANAPEGGEEIPIRFAKACSQVSQKMRISYHRGGGTKTVTGTVEAAAMERQEAEERQAREAQEARERQAREAQEARERQEAKARQEAREHQEAKEREVKASEEAAAAKKREAEQKAGSGGQGVAGFQSATVIPDAQLEGTTLQASTSGAIVVKISCPAGESVCVGKVTLRTLSAVSSGVSHTTSKKAILTLAAGSFDVPGGKVKTLTLHLSAKARLLLAHSHSLRVRATISAYDSAGTTHTSQKLATLRAPKPKHGRGG